MMGFTSGIECWSLSFIPILLGARSSFAYFMINSSIYFGSCVTQEGALGFSGLVECDLP